MKKALFLILCLCFVLTFCTTATAANEIVITVVPFGDHLLALANHRELLCIAPGHDHSIQVSEDQFAYIQIASSSRDHIDLLVAVGDKPAGSMFEIWRYIPNASMTGGEITQRITIQNLPENTRGLKFKKMVEAQNALWLLVRDDNSGIAGESFLYQIPMENGHATEVLSGPYYHMCANEDSIYLDRYDAANNDYTLVSLNLLSSHLKAQKQLSYASPNDGFPVCDPVSGDVLFSKGNDIVQWKNNKSEFIAYDGSITWTQEHETCLWNNQIIQYTPFASPKDIVMIDLSAQQRIELTHSIYGLNTLAFTTQYPSIRFCYMRMFREDLPSLLLSSSPDPALLEAYSGYSGFRGLVKNGYAAPLNDCPKIMETVGAFYPALLSALTNKDGQLCAVPNSFSASNTFTYNPDVLHAAGFTEDDLPATMADMVAFIQRWVAEVDDDSLYLFEQGYNDTAWSNLLETAIAIPLLTAQRDGETLSLMKDPSIRESFVWLVQNKELIERVSSTGDISDYSKILFAWDDLVHNITDRNNYDDKSQVDPRIQNSSFYKPLLLRADSEHDPIMPVYISVYAINHHASEKSIAAAKQYLSWYITHLDQWTRTICSPNENEPLMKDDYEDRLNNEKASIEFNQSLLDGHHGDLSDIVWGDVTFRDLQDDIQESTEYIQWLTDHPYSVTPDSIRPYREAALYMYAVDESWRESTSVKALYGQLLENKIAPDQFLQRLEQILIMQAMEDE